MPYISDEEGEYLVKTARKSIEYAFKGRNVEDVLVDFPPRSEKLLRPSGAFVTLNTYPKKELRGCIGYPEPSLPLIGAVVRAARAAAFEDPRFPPLSRYELDRVIVEVSVLTPPEKVTGVPREELPSRIVIGVHGLIVRFGPYNGLLLPQVAVEYDMSPSEFLDHTCLKAGLRPGCWKDEDVEVYTFSAEVFTETSPNGRVVREKLV